MAKEKEVVKEKKKKMPAKRIRPVSRKQVATIQLQESDVYRNGQSTYVPFSTLTRIAGETLDESDKHILYLNKRLGKYNVQTFFGIEMVSVDAPNATDNVSVYLELKVLKKKVANAKAK